MISQTEMSAQLVKPKRFSFIWFLVWVVTLFGWMPYLLYHVLLKREQQVYLYIDERGHVRETRDRR